MLRQIKTKTKPVANEDKWVWGWPELGYTCAWGEKWAGGVGELCLMWGSPRCPPQGVWGGAALWGCGTSRVRAGDRSLLCHTLRREPLMLSLWGEASGWGGDAVRWGGCEAGKVPVRRGGPALPQCWGMDSLRRQPSCGGGGWRQSCPPAVARENMLGKSILIFLSLLHASCFSTHPCLYLWAPFLTSAAHCSDLLLCGCCWLGWPLEASGRSQT